MLIERINKLTDERNRVTVDIRAIFEAADRDSKGVLSGEQLEKVATLEASDESLTKNIEAAQRQLDREKSLKEFVREPVGIGGGSAGGKSDAKPTEEERQIQFLRAWIKEGSEVKHRQEFRDLVAGSMDQGGTLVAPQQFVASLIKAIDNKVRMRQISTVIPMEKAASLGFPTLDTNPDDADWTTELGTGSGDTGMKTGKREFVPQPVAKRIKLSNKLLQISAIPVEELVRDRLTYKFGVTQEKAFLVGTGASQPLGVFTASAKGISTSRDVSTGNTTTSPTFDGLLEALYSLKEQYQEVASWMFHRLALKLLRKLKDGEGQYIWAPGGQAGQPDKLLGRPFYMSEYAPSTFTTGLYVGIIGDFKQYWIADVLQLQLQRLNELYAETNQTGWIGRMESDGAPVLEEAFARVKLA